MEAFETALAARRERGEAKETRIAEWCVGRALRALGRVEEALAIQQRLVAEWHAGRAEDAYVEEELGECLLALGREAPARPHLARAAELFGADPWLAEHEPERIARLRLLAAGRQTGRDPRRSSRRGSRLCARHGQQLGGASPLEEAVVLTPSRRQGRHREVGSEGSLRQCSDPRNTNRISRFAST